MVAASAGTGKTELLTGIYLAHTLGLHAFGRPLSPVRIVATTFSRASAREIRERLELRLAGVAGANPLEHEKRLGTSLLELAKAQGLTRSELQRRAALALDELPDATIDTLHNLCARILREHGLELGLAPSFSILEEQRALEDTEQAIDEVLTDALSAGGNAQGARQLLDACGGLERLRGSLLSLLSRLDDEGLDATSLERGDEAGAARRTQAKLEQTCRELASDPKSPRAGHARAVLDVLARGQAGVPDGAQLARAFTDLAAERKGRNAVGAKGLAELLEQGRGTNPERARSIARLIVEGPTLDERLRSIAQLIGEVQIRLRQRHIAHGTLGFGDLLRLTRDGLRDSPTIARAAGARIELLLVDEFQDTSRVQCELLLLLRERAESNRSRRSGCLPRAADIARHGLVVVGDRKQSIYGFRGADVSVFAELATDLAGAAATRLLDLPPAGDQPHEAMAEVSTLVDSYRSDRAIVQAVNLIAARDFVPQLNRSFEVRYAAAEALRVPEARAAADPGRILLVLEDGRTPEAEPLVARAQGALRTALAVAGFCARALAEGKSARSLAVLCRRRATLPLVGFALDHFGVPYVVSGRDLFGTPESRDIFAALRLSQAPRDRHALAVIARGPLGGLSDQALVELSCSKRGLLPAPEWKPQALSRPEDVSLAALLQRRLAGFCQIAPRLSPRDAIEDVVQRFELDSVLALLPRGSTRLANIGRLQEIAASHGGNLAAFVRFFTRQIALDTDETEAALFSAEDDAVRLLTIHGSKGLAFPTVILADADAVEGSNPAAVAILRRPRGVPLLVVAHAGEDGPLVTDTQRELSQDARARAQAERQRLSYVALTRAEHELVIPLPAQPRNGTLARTLLNLQREGAFSEIAGSGELALSELLEVPKLALSALAPASAPPREPSVKACADVVLGVTALADFCGCPRRFSLLQLQGLREPQRTRPAPPGGDANLARAAGTAAHHVLQRWPLERWGQTPEATTLADALREGGLDPASGAGTVTLAGLARFLGGPYALKVREQAVRVERELELTVVLNNEAAALLANASPEPRLVLKATLDLLVEFQDGSLHVIDYKRTRQGTLPPERYGPQLALYGSAVHTHFGKRPKLGLLHLLGDPEEPQWLTPKEPSAAELARAFLTAREGDKWEPVLEPVCRSLHCGFVSSCHARAV